MEIGENETVGELHDRMMHIGAQLMVRTLDQIEKGTCTTSPQPELSHVKTAPKLNRDFCRLSLSLSVSEFHNKLRGLSPSPGAWMETLS